MGQGNAKVTVHFEKYFNGTENGLYAKYISRPLLISVFEYSTTEALKLMLDNGADLTEYYKGIKDNDFILHTHTHSICFF